MSDSLPGRKLDQFVLETMLGQGGMARVYRAWDTLRSVYVAVKVIDKAFRNDSDYTRRFELEAQAIKKLTHPHIVRLFQYGEADGVLYMAMAYIEGSNLEDLLANYKTEGQSIPAQDAIRIVRQVCAALDYAHSEGIIHRDIKSANIMIDEHGDAILTDFGLALLTEVGTYGEIFGSPHYLAPEQAISSAGAVPQSDFYSLGVVLYEMFTNQLPFDDEKPMDIAMKHLTEEPVPPSQINPAISPELEAVILKTMAKKPEDRYPNGAALAQAFEHAIQYRTSTRPASRQSIADRVAFEVAQNPLPPPPAAVNTPALTLPHVTHAPQSLPQRSITPTISAPVQMPSIRNHPWIIYAGFATLLVLCLSAMILFFLFGNDDTENDDRRNVTNAEAAGILTTDTPTQTPPAAPVTDIAPSTPTPFRLSTSVPPGVGVSTSLPIPSPTLAPTLTRGSAANSTPFTLSIYMRGDDSLFVVNTTASGRSFPIERLRLGSGKGAVDGSDWDIPSLDANECVTVWKSGGKPKSPNVDCVEVGDRLRRKGSERFWKSNFDVYLDGEKLGRCEGSKCMFTFYID